MMSPNNQKTIDQIKSLINTNEIVKIVFYAGAAVISLYVIGKSFSALATAIRGFNELKSAINGN